MADPAIALLQTELNQSPDHTLWLVDENIDPKTLPSCRPGIRVVGNRFDLIRSLQAQGWPATFSDFDLPTSRDGYARILYRISKEKPVVHYLINRAAELLMPGGELILLGDKSEGIKTYSRKAQQYLGGDREEHKQGSFWRCRLTRGTDTGEHLDDQHYTEIRVVAEDANHRYLSKPGLFGWNKLDRGSAFLVEQLPAMLDTPLPLSGRVLDLGCGFGYLAVNCAGPDTELYCTDNNAAALALCRANLQQTGLSGEVIASDAGDSLEGVFDTILCNPPFHAGFGIEGDLTDRFLAASQRLLSANGSACFVVNQHIPLERKAQSRFAQIHCHADNGHFKLIRLRSPL